MDNRELAKTIVEKIGGSENVKLYTHCITRLRFILKDKSKVDEEGLRQIKEIMGIVDRGGQYQLVIGGDVERVFNELPPFLPGVDQEKPVEETEEQTTEEKKSILQTVIALMGEMGFKTYRMSISWARIYPTGMEETPNEEGLRFYDAVFDELHKYSIEPMVTLHHFEVPLGLCNAWGGWADRRTVDCFVRFCRTVFERYKNKVTYWLTFNEINNIPIGFLSSGISTDDPAVIMQAAHHQQHYFFTDVQCRGYYPSYYCGMGRWN